MGQTLSHGVYLPNEGERNCYAGLASNWQILNTAVGAIAEKAPLVHTHTVSQITDFPAYGTTAGTICEGNDSRLSDARTPVAHTHTKSDVTDLLNSNFIPSANNSYDLGSSSNQWNNLYAKNYFYNGVAWGLDKANVWSANNEYKYLIGLSGAEIWFKQLNIEDITANPDADISKSIIQIYNKTVTQYSGGIADTLRTDGSHRLIISCFGFPLNNYAGYYPHTFYFEAKRDGTASFSPSYTNASLGTSTNKWKTFNGLNPGALSLPDMGTTADINYFDFTSTITPLDGTDIFYRPPVDGWMTVIIAGTALSLFEDASSATNHNQGSGISAAPVKGYCEATIPVHKNVRVKINAIGTSVYMAQVRPCMGNV